MIAKPIRSEVVGVFGRVAHAIGPFAALGFALFPAMAHAQVNIDQGKSAADIYANVCTACHKTMRGLAAGKNSLMLSAFLREHYTASSTQASALAAYVLGAGGAEPAPKQKPESEHARAEEPKSRGPKAEAPKAAEPKVAGRKVGEPKVAEPKVAEPKSAPLTARASVTPEEEARPRVEPREEDAKQEERPGPASADRHDVHPETASRGEQRAPENATPLPPEQAPAPAVSEAPHAVPTPSAMPNPLPSLELGSTTRVATPAEAEPTAGVTAPRDSIPD
jgi:hypothetical protein